MRVIAIKPLREFWEHHADAEKPLRAWYNEVSKATWKNSYEVIQMYNSADVAGDRIVFNIGGNKYRLVVKTDFVRHGFLVRFIGTHADYDKINVRTV